MTNYTHKDDCRHWTTACVCRRPHEQTWAWNDDLGQMEVADDSDHVILETDSGCYGPRGGEIPLIEQAPAMARLLLTIHTAMLDDDDRVGPTPIEAVLRAAGVLP